MDSQTRSRLARRAKVIKAMAHEARLCIVEALARSPMCVNDLTSIVGSDVSTVSRHLAVLHNAAIVDSRRDGARIIYRLRCPCVLDFFRCVEQVLVEATSDSAGDGGKAPCSCSADRTRGGRR